MVILRTIDIYFPQQHDVSRTFANSSIFHLILLMLKFFNCCIVVVVVVIFRSTIYYSGPPQNITLTCVLLKNDYLKFVYMFSFCILLVSKYLSICLPNFFCFP